MFDFAEVGPLKERARALRVDALRAIARAGRGSPGSSLSAADLVATMIFHEMVVDPSAPDRDRLVVSAITLRPLVAVALGAHGLLPADSPSPGAPGWPALPCSHDAPAASLGQGISLANGLALGLRSSAPTARVFALLGDGELQAGQVWEAALTAAHHGLGAVTVVVDVNGGQFGGAVAATKGLEPLADKFRAFGWDALLVNGHSVADLMRAFGIARRAAEKPTAILARTRRGRGLKDFEGLADVSWPTLSPGQAEVMAGAVTVLED